MDDSPRHPGRPGQPAAETTGELRQREPAIQPDSTPSLREIFDRMPTLIKALGTDNTFVLWNKECERVTGYRAAEIVGNPHALELLYPDAAERRAVFDGLHSRGNDFRNWPLALTCRDGTQRTISWSSIPDPIPGEDWALCTVGVDVTDRDRFRTERDRFFNLSIDMLTVADIKQPNFRQLNPAWTNCLGWSAEELLDKPYMHFVHPDDHARTEAAQQQLMDGQIVADFLNRYRHRDGSYRWLSWSAFGDLKNNLIYAIARDVTDTQQMQQDLQQSESRYRDLVETSPFGIAMHSGEKMIFLNDAACRLFGAEPGTLEGTDAMERVHVEFHQVVAERMDLLFRGHDIEPMEQQFIRVDGTPFWVEVWSSRVEHNGVAAAQVIFSDVTERKEAELRQRRLQEQLQQVQKMESIGQLAGGVAHDFNNILTGINGFAEVVLNSLKADDPLRNPMVEIRRAGERAAGLTQQLLAFSRRQPISPSLLNANEVLANARTMLARIIGEDIQLVFQPATDLWAVRIDAGQLEQVVLNLATNSRDAMPEGGVFSISTRNTSSSPAETVGDTPEGDWVEISVTDSGEGMTPEVAEHIFEPFFSTKAQGKGTGLGLSTVYGIVKQNNGFIHCRSIETGGTAFRILLPRSSGAPTPLHKATPTPAVGGGTETVLVVEDEEMVRDLTQTILSKRGYTVLSAGSSNEAWDLFRRHPDVELLLTDVVLPGQNGKELYDSMRQARPELKVLYMSGYSENILSERGARADNVAFVAKPFSVDELLNAVRATLSL